MLDGSAVATESLTAGGSPLLYDGTHPIVVGTDLLFPTEQYKGAVGQVALFNQAIPADELTNQYRTAVGG